MGAWGSSARAVLKQEPCQRALALARLLSARVRKG
jgi:hypothetical protein